jgi:hypothetical protein
MSQLLVGVIAKTCSLIKRSLKSLLLCSWRTHSVLILAIRREVQGFREKASHWLCTGRRCARWWRTTPERRGKRLECPEKWNLSIIKILHLHIALLTYVKKLKRQKTTGFDYHLHLFVFLLTNHIILVGQPGVARDFLLSALSLSVSLALFLSLSLSISISISISI